MSEWLLTVYIIVVTSGSPVEVFTKTDSVTTASSEICLKVGKDLNDGLKVLYQDRYHIKLTCTELMDI